MTHLVITAANVPEKECLGKFGYPFEVRSADYLSSFDQALRWRRHFDSMAILETIAGGPVSFLENSGIPVHYSTSPNSYANKGVNEVLHLWDFLDRSKFADADIILKLTGRYLLVGTQILSHFTDAIEAVAKDDGDLYDPSSRGVHTFLWAFRKRFLRQFVAALDRSSEDPIEWHVKAFARHHRALILDQKQKLGVITCLYSPETRLWRRALC